MQIKLKVFIFNLLRRKVLAVTVSFLMISFSFFLFFLYEKDQNLWTSIWEGESNYNNQEGVALSPKYYTNQPDNLTSYNIELNFTMEGFLYEVEFCDKYSWILNLINPSRTGIYYNINTNEKKHFSKFDYSKEHLFKQIQKNKNNNINIGRCRAKNIKLILACDLLERSVGVYLNNKFYEKIYLDDKDLNYRVSLNTSTNTRVFLQKMRIYNNQGVVFFSFNDAHMSNYKILSQFILILGLAIIVFFVYSEKSFFIRLLCIITIIFVMEAYLRITEKDNAYLNIHGMTSKWDIEKTTNIFRNYDSVDEIEIGSSLSEWRRRKYPIAKSKDALRIMCLGSSPVEGVAISSPEYRFSNILERKINSRGNKKCEVINAGVTDFIANEIKLTIYFSDVLIKFNPDIVIIYSDWGVLIKKDNVLYERMKDLVQLHSSWLTNQRLLRMALEFKKPTKEIVYLYNFLCESYLFMGMEYLRGRITHLNSNFYSTLLKKKYVQDSPFKKILNLCEEKKIKILLIPQFDFCRLDYCFKSEDTFKGISAAYENVYFLGLKEVFLRSKDFVLATDSTHPNDYGHEIIAEEIYRKLIKEGLISEN